MAHDAHHDGRSNCIRFDEDAFFDPSDCVTGEFSQADKA